MDTNKKNNGNFVKKLMDGGAFGLLALYILFCLFPILWIILTSFKTHAAINTFPPQFIFIPSFENYNTLLTSHDFIGFLTNSIITATVSTALVMALGIPAAYSLARYGIGGHRLSDWILSMRMFPPIALVVPLFLMFRFVHLLQTVWALILVYTAMNLPFAIWLMIGFFKDVPKDIDDAALVDGCTPWTALWKINVPAVAPGLAAAAILSIIFAWNEFLFAVILGGGTAKTLPVAVAGYVTDRAIFWGPMSAASVIALVPIVIFAMFVQRYLVRGLTLGAVD
ncbi:MAG: carbohydrate ABC transporter permease [Chloroflexi bacterium]|nr:MAG: carbohydrate ABC transporter permease [Chloroflexota bacterium]